MYEQPVIARRAAPSSRRARANANHHAQSTRQFCGLSSEARGRANSGALLTNVTTSNLTLFSGEMSVFEFCAHPNRSLKQCHQGTCAIEYQGEIGVCLQHLGILVRSEAQAKVWPDVISWLNSQS